MRNAVPEVPTGAESPMTVLPRTPPASLPPVGLPKLVLSQPVTPARFNFDVHKMPKRRSSSASHRGPRRSPLVSFVTKPVAVDHQPRTPNNFCLTPTLRSPERYLRPDDDKKSSLKSYSTMVSECDQQEVLVNFITNSTTNISRVDAPPRLIKKTAKKENWFIPYEDISMEPKPFANGAQASIYKGNIRGTNVCIKKLTKIQDLEDILREIALWRSVRHPSIVMFLGASFTPKSGPLIVMEVMHHGDLTANVDKLTRTMQLETAISLAEGLAWLHGNNPAILHRDLKPQNILFDKHMRAKITDLGLSRLQEIDAGKHTMTGKTGTLRYMAPEIDVFSFGLLVYYIFLKSQPFVGFSRKKRESFAKEGQDFKIAHNAQCVVVRDACSKA
eukprot:jgi/Bigna1/137652/aug1.40_g12360